LVIVDQCGAAHVHHGVAAEPQLVGGTCGQVGHAARMAEREW
jgi:hypothetical protein